MCENSDPSMQLWHPRNVWCAQHQSHNLADTKSPFHPPCRGDNTYTAYIILSYVFKRKNIKWRNYMDELLEQHRGVKRKRRFNQISDRQYPLSIRKLSPDWTRLRHPIQALFHRWKRKFDMGRHGETIKL